jgi:hypothetical protein
VAATAPSRPSVTPALRKEGFAAPHKRRIIVIYRCFENDILNMIQANTA